MACPWNRNLLTRIHTTCFLLCLAHPRQPARVVRWPSVDSLASEYSALWSVLCLRNPSQTSSLWQFPSYHSSDNVVCAVLKKPQPDWFTVAVSFQSQQWQCGLCCVEETTARLVYCDSFLPITAVTMWSVLCWRNHSQTSSLWQFPANHSSDNVVCAVLKKPQPDWFTVTVSFQSQQWQCGLCCVEETTARLVYCDSFLPITAVTMWSVLCWRNHSQISSLWQFPSNHSSDNVVCAVLKKPQPDWFTVTVSFQSQQWQCGLCCVEETPARLVYCDSFLLITAVTMWSVLCWSNFNQTSLLWQFPFYHNSDNVVCAVLKKPQPDWFTVTVSFQSQQWQCGLCCVEETTTRLLHCDSFLPITAVTM